MVPSPDATSVLFHAGREENGGRGERGIGINDTSGIHPSFSFPRRLQTKTEEEEEEEEGSALFTAAMQ